MSAAVLNQPVDLASPLQPSRIIYINALSGRNHSDIYDFTSQLQSSYTSEINPDFMDSAQRVFNTNPEARPTWHLQREKWYSNSRVVVTSPAAAGGERAKWNSPLLAHGTTKIVFPSDSPHCGHPISVEALSIFSNGMGFVKDSISYVWQSTHSQERGLIGVGSVSLYKAMRVADGAKKMEVARYRSFSGKFEVGGVLVLEAREIDMLVTTLTLLAVLGQRASFFMPGTGRRASTSALADGSAGITLTAGT